MQHRWWILVSGAVLVLVGGLGLFAVGSRSPLALPMSGGQIRLSGTDSSLGARIYLDGLGEDGTLPRTAAGPGMMGGGCVTCHGIDGRGDRASVMMGTFDAPDIRYGTLVGTHAEEGEHAEEGNWTDDDIRRAIEDGVEPGGERLDPFMPRWELSEAEFDALIEYLKELSDR